MATETRDAEAFLDEILGGPLTFGEALNAIRLCDERSLLDFAAQLGISRQHLCDVEKGRRTVSLARAAEWGRILGYGEALFARLAIEDQARAAGLEVEVIVKGPTKGRRKPRRDGGARKKAGPPRRKPAP